METKGLKLIGKGLFSKVFKLNDKQVLIQSVCNVKECLSMDWHQSTGIFPKIESIDYQEYTCEYYDKVSSIKYSLCPKHYEIYKDLRSLSINRNGNNYDLSYKWIEEFKKVKDKKYREALLDMIECLHNYGSDIDFEISPRNIAIKNGKLILLDVFYFKNHAITIQHKHRKAVYA